MTQAVDKRTDQAKKNKHKAFHSAKDYEQSASQIGDIEPTPSEAKIKARKVVAEQLLRQEPEASVDDLGELLKMLGLHPSQPDWDDGPTTSLVRYHQ